MAIYTRFGSEIELLTARLIPIWIEQLPGEIKWHYSEKKPSKRTREITVMPCWHVTAKYVEDGKLVLDGQEFSSNELRADGAVQEIYQAMWTINPAHKDAFQDWCAGKKPIEYFSANFDKTLSLGALS